MNYLNERDPYLIPLLAKGITPGAAKTWWPISLKPGAFAGEQNSDLPQRFSGAMT